MDVAEIQLDFVELSDYETSDDFILTVIYFSVKYLEDNSVLPVVVDVGSDFDFVGGVVVDVVEFDVLLFGVVQIAQSETHTHMLMYIIFT